MSKPILYSGFFQYAPITLPEAVSKTEPYSVFEYWVLNMNFKYDLTVLAIKGTIQWVSLIVFRKLLSSKS